MQAQRLNCARLPQTAPFAVEPLQDPAAALATCISHIEKGDLDALLEFVPDEGERRRPRGPPAPRPGGRLGPQLRAAGARRARSWRARRPHLRFQNCWPPTPAPAPPPQTPPSRPAVIDRVIEMRRCNIGGGDPTYLRFTDVLQANASSLLFLDSFAVRHLAHGAPRALRLLSAVRVSADRYLQRCAVVAESGEEAVLAFEMMQQECAESQ